MSNSKNKGHSHHDPASDEFRKEDFPFYWLARVHGRYTQNMERLLKKIDLDVPRWRVLWILNENGESSIFRDLHPCHCQTLDHHQDRLPHERRWAGRYCAKP